MVGVAQRQDTVVKKVVAGIVGGAIGGVVFGMLMAMMGMLPMIAGLVGSMSPVVGFVVHMVISVFIGATFGLIFGNAGITFGRAALLGLVYGMVWWVLGPLVIMPSMLGMGLQFNAAFSGANLLSLMGHMIYGVVTGLGYAWFIRRS